TDFDPILHKLASTNTFDSDWPTLQHHFRLALQATLPVFTSLGQPRSPSSHPQPGHAITDTPITSSDAKGDAPPEESLLLSPSRPTTGLLQTQGSLSHSPGSMTPSPPEDAPVHPSLRPSTRGGLVLPPFPPLDPNRRRGGRIQSSYPELPSRPNGAGPSRPMVLYVYDDEWDENVVIGGKKLPGWLEEEDAKKEVDRLLQILDDLDYPPFTIQRLAELLIFPTGHHNTLGKYLRAVEKSLLVTTPWEPPSYTYIPNGTQGAARSYFGVDSDSASDSGSEESTMPPGSGTPMFSPIPFLAMDHDEPWSEQHENGGDNKLGGLMSPLILGESHKNGNGNFRFGEGSSIGPRSPTPEPEDMELSTTAAAAIVTGSDRTGGAGEHDPGHQPYLGRVDELDTGPLPPTPELRRSGRHIVEEQGTGEGGNMTPHGMSDKPVPITSTTTVVSEP
ncbi:hypothetical protein TREMEDRAFT_14806, partial [Tremella mesenterica DSM 1558]|uniref:uncharacterized protein n=1 Tax=Tremella mesenterica (strain ATCC 24925 / CBS 8224 / DSM 1558 / NBRC 9311 / NRRL Y-6157 / RJB 2259-6 / UBC 559-6) TaxID=578456 RepID=UPI0003F49272